MIKKIPGFGLLKKIPAKKSLKKGFLTVGCASAVMAPTVAVKYTEPVEKMSIQFRNRFFTDQAVGDSVILQKQLAEFNRMMLLKNRELLQQKRLTGLVARIMDEDKACCQTIDKDKMAENIVNLSKEYGANPVHIACIIKKESHFTENINKSSGKGLMQLTSIAVKDMYTRPGLYHPLFENIKKEYPTHQSLFAAIQVNPELNMRVGIIAFLQRLEKSNGNVGLALQNYNGSSHKVAYANAIMKDIKKYIA